jgi:hypothetical protein
MAKPAKRKKLTFSRPFYAYSVSDAPEVQAALDEVFEVVAKSSQYPRRRPRRRNVLPCVQAIVLDLFRAYMAKQRQYLGISFGSDHWTGTNRYMPIQIGVSPLRKVRKALLEAGMIEYHEGYENVVDGISYNSRIRAKPPLIRLFRRHGVTPGMIVDHPDQETIILKDTDKKVVGYPDNATTRRMRRRLRTINKVIAGAGLRLGITWDQFDEIQKQLQRKAERGSAEVIDFTKVTLRRVFNNNSLEQGGRFYHGWWINTPSDYRPYLEIDKTPTMEIDYSSFHIQMVYDLQSASVPTGDPYELPDIPKDKEWRKRLKVILQTIINADSRKKAIGSIRDEFKGVELPTAYKDWGAVMDAFIDKHSPIADYFNSGKGVEFQYHDSRLAETIMLEMIRRGTVALPVHDSFIVKDGWEDQLREVMLESYRKMFRSTPKVKMEEVYNPKDRYLRETKGYQGVPKHLPPNFGSGKGGYQDYKSLGEEYVNTWIGIDSVRP